MNKLVNITNKRKLYATMKRIRMVEEAIAKNYSDGKMRCPIHLSIGQEAVPSAVTLCTSKSDIAVSTHRSHAHYLAKGGDLKAMIAELYGKHAGCSKGKGGSMHLIDMEAGFAGSSAIVGNSIPIGTGIALSMKLKKLDGISIIYFGDGATEEGAFYESLNFAAVQSLNTLFICENNLYSVYSPLNVRQAESRSLMKIAEGIGVKRRAKLNGNDAIESLETIKGIVGDMRKKCNPAIIEFTTYRWREHCGPSYDNDLGYRDVEEFEAWQQKDPILILKQEIIAEDKDFEKWEKALENKIYEEIKEAFNYAEKEKFPAKDTLKQHIYAI